MSSVSTIKHVKEDTNRIELLFHYDLVYGYEPNEIGLSFFCHEFFSSELLYLNYY